MVSLPTGGAEVKKGSSAIVLHMVEVVAVIEEVNIVLAPAHGIRNPRSRPVATQIIY